MQEPNVDRTETDVIAQDGAYEGSASVESPTPSHAPKAPGLKIARRFTEPGEDVWSTVEWEKRSAIITGEKGDVVFEQHDIDVPKSWTQLAANVVASKYIRGHVGTPERESSVRQLIQDRKSVV